MKCIQPPYFQRFTALQIRLSAHPLAPHQEMAKEFAAGDHDAPAALDSARFNRLTTSAGSALKLDARRILLPGVQPPALRGYDVPTVFDYIPLSFRDFVVVLSRDGLAPLSIEYVAATLGVSKNGGHPVRSVSSKPAAMLHTEVRATIRNPRRRHYGGTWTATKPSTISKVMHDNHLGGLLQDGTDSISSSTICVPR